jgi:hypothetical protein
MSLRSVAAALLCLFALTPLVRADGLLQLRFGGKVDRTVFSEERKEGHFVGQLVEVEIGANVAGKPHSLTLHVHLAPGTTGVELARLVERRLTSIGIKIVATSDSGNLWVESAEYVHLRLGGGLRAEVAMAEGPPASLAIRPPTRDATELALRVDVTTVIRPSGGLPVRGAADLVIPLGKDSSAASISAALARAGQKEWISDRPTGDTWRPIRMTNGAAITGFSMGLGNGQGDWRVELRL